MIRNPIYGKIKNGNQTTNQKTFANFSSPILCWQSVDTTKCWYTYYTSSTIFANWNQHSGLCPEINFWVRKNCSTSHLFFCELLHLGDEGNKWSTLTTSKTPPSNLKVNKTIAPLHTNVHIQYTSLSENRGGPHGTIQLHSLTTWPTSSPVGSCSRPQRFPNIDGCSTRSQSPTYSGCPAGSPLELPVALWMLGYPQIFLIYPPVQHIFELWTNRNLSWEPHVVLKWTNCFWEGSERNKCLFSKHGQNHGSWILVKHVTCRAGTYPCRF